MRFEIGLRLSILPLMFLLVHCSDPITLGSIEAGAGGEPGEDPCANIACECKFSTDCGAHERCDTTTPGGRCVCALGYEDAGSGCEFADVPADPGFEDGTPWEGSTGAGVDPLAAGDIDPGEAFISETGVCALATVSQTFTMPDLGRAGLLAVDVNYRQLVQDASGADSVGVAVSVNDAWNELPFQDSLQVQSFCLGEAGSTGEVSFELSPNQISSYCDATPTTSLSIDRFAARFAEEGECPLPGRVLNGDFEDSHGWEFVSTGDGEASFSQSGGVGSSAGARLVTQTRCSSASAQGRISLPTEASVGGAAIEFYLTGSGAALEVSLGGRPVSSLRRSSGTRFVCVPGWAKGSVQDITFALPQVHFTGDCSVARVRTAVVDEITIVSEPSFCGSDQTPDLGFEVPLNALDMAPGWAVTPGAYDGTEAPADIWLRASGAHTGFGVLRLLATNVCNGSSATRRIVVPDADGANGPAIRFFSMVALMQGESGIRIVDGASPAVHLLVPETGEWEQSTICIPPRHIGRPLTIQLFTEGGGASDCGDFTIPSVGLFDDVEITTDATCPVM